ncbi:crosslink repair DNA glycosylase YcaQ family protein [Nonomuraea sp. NPDC049637]|uniref:DNA glycosylase AlkZ-like family protein n=1 Tax=Nonomuraea sp. NPDC049637 TaxID=3154356 RepID=UPI0034363845
MVWVSTVGRQASGRVPGVDRRPRRRSAKRVYDLAERRVPADLLHARPSEHASLTALPTKGAHVYGVATTADLNGYFPLPRAAAAQAAHDTGLLPATVERWDEPAWVHPATLEGTSPLNPPGQRPPTHLPTRNRPYSPLISFLFRMLHIQENQALRLLSWR